MPRTRDREGGVWSNCLSDMSFAGGRRGWAVGSGQLLETCTGGATWKNRFHELPQGWHLNAERVAVPEQDRCWVVGIPGTARSPYFITRGKGSAWRAQNLAHGFQPGGIFFIDASRGWLAGRRSSPHPSVEIFRTCNGGRRWSSTRFPIRGIAQRISFVDLKNGWLLVEAFKGRRTVTSLYRSKNGGRTWNRIARFDAWIRALCPVTDKRIFVGGENGIIARSNDGGVSWQRVQTSGKECINSIVLSRWGTGLACADLGCLLVSTDSGESWTARCPRPSLGGYIHSVFVSKRRGLICGTLGIGRFSITSAA